MIGPFVFLDIDGVLNHHEPYRNKYCGTCPNCVDLFNGILDRTGAKVVLVSAWRYYILRGEMNLAGMNGLLATHGLNHNCVVGYVGPDQSSKKVDRGLLVNEWFRQNYGTKKMGNYIAIDDNNFGYTTSGLYFVQTNGSKGLCGESQHSIEYIESCLLHA